MEGCVFETAHDGACLAIPLRIPDNSQHILEM